MGYYLNGIPINLDTVGSVSCDILTDKTYTNSGYSGVLFDRTNSNVNVFNMVLPVEHEEVYTRFINLNQQYNDKAYSRYYICYDADMNYIGTVDNTSSVMMRYAIVRETIGNSTIYCYGVAKNTLLQGTKYIQHGTKCDAFLFDKIVISNSDILSYYGDEQEENAMSVLVIGDSNTNWHGGTDLSDGFLKVVHDEIGVYTSNEGLAGAQWQDASGQTQSAVQRVDKLIEDGRKYDCYAFIMGTNGNVDHDTGSTSADHSADMCGGMRYCMERLKAYDPTGRIIVFLPFQRAEGNATQEKANEVIKSIANHYAVPVADMYHECGVVPKSVINVNYLADGLHLGDEGVDVAGKYMASKLKELLCI